MSGAVTPSKAEIEAVERDLYARLGITPNATREDLAAAYEAVQAYLAAAPRDLRDWAKARSSEVDEAYALLSDPAALAGAVALVGAVERPARQPGGPATPPARRATPPVAEPETDDDDEADDQADEDEAIASVTPDTHRDSVRARPKSAAKPAGSNAKARRNRRTRLVRRAAAVVVVAAAAVVVAFAGYQFGPGANAAQPSPSAAANGSPTPTLDTATVSSLMQKIATNPNDVTSLIGLANAYFRAEDYKTAADWATKAVAADPKSVDAYVALGASQYNKGDQAAAETAWKQAVTLDPKNVEAHYDLGFLYFAAQPQDTANAVKEWQTVIALDPTSDLATSLKAHLDSMTGASPAPSGSVTPSGSPAPSGSAAPSATSSPAASSSAQP